MCVCAPIAQRMLLSREPNVRRVGGEEDSCRSLWQHVDDRGPYAAAANHTICRNTHHRNRKNKIWRASEREIGCVNFHKSCIRIFLLAAYCVWWYGIWYSIHTTYTIRTELTFVKQSIRILHIYSTTLNNIILNNRRKQKRLRRKFNLNSIFDQKVIEASE